VLHIHLHTYATTTANTIPHTTGSAPRTPAEEELEGMSRSPI